jgi:methyl acetate hydrolase
MTNQIGALNVREMVAVASNWSNSIDQSQDQKLKWGYSFDINEEPVPNGRSAGNIRWAGLLNCFYWVDPAKQVTGATLTRAAPFYDVLGCRTPLRIRAGDPSRPRYGLSPPVQVVGPPV